MRDLPEGLRVVANGIDISDAIRTPEVTRLIYRLDQIPEVRAQLVKLQQDFGEKHPTVAEGRDIGTVVFPEAACKIYMDAELDVRTRRRAEQMIRSGAAVDEAALREEIAERDAGSMQREHSPLRQADDAVRLDTSEMDQGEVINAIVKLAKERLCIIPR
jgi:cytidylate kinase